MAELKVGVNFEFLVDNYLTTRIFVLPGGTRSTKTFSVIQFIFWYCLSHKGKQIVIARDTRTNLVDTVLKDFKAIAYGFIYEDDDGIDQVVPAMYSELKINKTELTADINGNTIKFIGLNDDPLRVHGMKSDVFFINEAIGTYQDSFDQLEQRCTGFGILDCNPSLPNSWVYQLEKRTDAKFFRTTFLDNPFLGIKQVKKIKSYEDTQFNREQGTVDVRKWAVYGEGKTFKGKEIIYPDWETYEDEPENYDQRMYGQDFGWVHPAATIQVINSGNKLYLKEIFYASYTPTPVLIQAIKEELNGREECYIVCDSEDQKAINEFRQADLPAFPVKKPAGSVLSGIRKCQKYQIFIHKDSHNLQREMNNYKWKVNRGSNDILDIPVKEHDDAMDAFRYVVYTFL